MTLIIERPYRPPVTATRQDDDTLVIRTGRTYIRLDAGDLFELYAYAAHKPTIQRYPAMALKKPSDGDI